MSLNKIKYLLAVTLPLIALQTQPAMGQGSLTPPGGPAPTMKSLAEIEPRTAISSLPYAITAPGSYYVTTNLTSALAGISISSGNVTLDLNGFTLQGGPGAGVYINGTFTNITVRNGTVVNWASVGVDGYFYGTPHNVLFENLTVSACGTRGIAANHDSIIRNCRAYGNAGLGIYAYSGLIVECTARANLTGGIFVYNGTIRDCHAEGNNSTGIECNGGSVLDSDSVNNTGWGISLYGGGSARRCHVYGNTSAGIITPNNAPLLGGVISDCVVATNYYGINLSCPGYMVTGNELSYNPNAGIIVQSSGNRIDNNHIAVLSGYYGITLTSASFTNNVIIRNTVFNGGSTANNYNITVAGNDVGPIGNASTNTSPWANISH